MEYIFLMETTDKISETQTEEIYDYKWFDPDEILAMKPNIEAWDFMIEMLEKIIGIGEDNTLIMEKILNELEKFEKIILVGGGTG